MIGFFRGTLEGSVNFSMAVPKAGMSEKFVDIVLSPQPVKVVVQVADDLWVEVAGIMQGADFAFGENSHMTGDFAVTGKIRKAI